MNDAIFICRCHPYDYFFVTPDRNEATKWASRNRSSAGELQIKRVRWNMLKDNVVIQFKPKDIDVMQDVVNLRSITGGKEPPQDGDWLSLLDVGTIFLVQRKNNTGEFALGEFILMNKDLSNPKVAFVMSEDGKRMSWNPVRFCNQFSHYKTIGVVEIPGEIPKESDLKITQEEEKNNESDRAEHPPEQTP